MHDKESIIGLQVEALRQSLLDLTMRNKLINFKPSKRRTIRVVDEIPREIYDILVLQEKNMRFLDYKPEIADEVEENPFHEPFENYWMSHPPNAIEKKHVDNYLQTVLNKAELQKKLTFIYRQSKSIFEEQGYSVLFLAIGFLKWTESNSSQGFRYAPLILIPVELERPEVRSQYILKWTGEDIFTNISLQTKLVEQGVSIPNFEMTDDKMNLDKYFKKVSKSIANYKTWAVVDEIYLGFFSFTKFVMYKDLDPQSWGLKDFGASSLFGSLFSAAEKDVSDFDDGFSEKEVDTRLKVSDMHHVLDADPSQIAVIEDVKAGKNMVVQGPPGTGKSQTIVNIIGELMVSGKSILFVSEKMAALEVVKRRLDSVGLGSFCLELHSRKSKRKEVLKEIERTVNREPPSDISLDAQIERLEKLRDELNAYASILREPVGLSELSPHTLFSMREEVRSHFEFVKRKMLSFDIPKVEKLSPKKVTAAIRSLDDLSSILKPLIPIAKHPWNGVEIQTVLLPADLEKILKMIDDLEADIANLTDVMNEIEENWNIQKSRNLVEAQDLFELLPFLKAYPCSITTDVILNPSWNNLQSAKSLVSKINEYHRNLSALRFDHSLLDIFMNEKIAEFRTLSAKPLRFLSINYRRLKKELREHHPSLPEKDDEILNELDLLLRCQRLRKEIRENTALGKNLFGTAWEDEYSDPDVLNDIEIWTEQFHQKLKSGFISEITLRYLENNHTQRDVFEVFYKLEEAIDNVRSTRDRLSSTLKINYKQVFSKKEMNVPFDQWLSKLKFWRNNISRLGEWRDYYYHKTVCAETSALPFINLIEQDLVAPEDIVPCYRGNYADALLKFAFENHPELSNFNVKLHEKKVREFAEMDRKMIFWNRERLICDIYNSQPRLDSSASPNSSVGIILREINRKRRHMPIRKFISSTLDVLLKIKPCFMMSPLSVAQFLEPNTVKFDVVIFDEASQVKPEDALGAIARGSQLVVLGDTHQLPPTSFFDHIVDPDEEYTDELVSATSDVESILHLCRRRYPTKTLRWHYRSRHESLIEVSNQEFYDNSLLIYPSPDYETDEIGLKFVHLPNAIYDRGRSSINKVEAQAVAKYVVEHYRNNPEKSLGVGTFNIRQQHAILEEIDHLLMETPDIESNLYSNEAEPFFVKNLEIIQGDERDVILLSVAFGFDSTGKLSRNFGPLNQDGGERRLNVLITRAREKCIVFSNFKAKDLLIESNSPFGLRALKTFLQYAETRDLVQKCPTGGDADSPFEEAVYNYLRSEGFNIHKQVGTAKYRIDMAVIDPSNPGRYILGIECDGATYHSSEVARERDRLRQQVLENLGWKLYRIWSTDWYRNRKKAEENLLTAVRTAIETKDSVVTRKPEISETEEFITEPEHIENHTNKLTEKDIFGSYPEVIDYEKCTSLNISTWQKLHEISPYELSKAVTRIVDIEGPIHIDEIIRRIREHWGLKRSGNRIQDNINRAILIASQNKSVTKKGKFLYSYTNSIIQARRRNNDPAPKIELISDEEITEAIILVLRHQFSTPQNELAVPVSRLFGFKSTSSQTAEQIDRIIRKMLRMKSLTKNENGLITLQEKV